MGGPWGAHGDPWAPPEDPGGPLGTHGSSRRPREGPWPPWRPGEGPWGPTGPPGDPWGAWATPKLTIISLVNGAKRFTFEAFLVPQTQKGKNRIYLQNFFWPQNQKIIRTTIYRSICFSKKRNET